MFVVDDIEINILIVDDEPELRSILADFLSETFNCVQVESAEDALTEIRRKSFAVVITDVNLSGMNGIDLIPLILSDSPQTVVTVISGQQSLDDAIRAMRHGAFDYVTKPFDLHQVNAVVRRGVEHYELQVIKRRYDLHLEELVALRTAELDNALEAVENSYRATLKSLVQALETRDFETHGHSERVVTFSLRLGHEMGLNAEQLRELELGALLHDIGKIGVPDAILRKPAQLTEDEWVKMRMHPNYGVQILRGIPFLDGANLVVAQHHEKWDGTGYPNKLKGEEINLNARIFSVVDAFDAIISDRVYRAGRSYEEACSEIKRCSGSQFDAEIVAAFFRVPKEDWETLQRRSTQRRPEQFSYQTFVTEVINGQNNFEFDSNPNALNSNNLTLTNSGAYAPLPELP